MEKRSNSFGIIFYVKKHRISQGKVPIYVRITVNSKRADISTKRFVEEKNWNNDKGLAKGSKEEISRLNNYLEQIRAQIVADYQQMMFQKKIITAELLRNSFLGRDRNSNTLISLMQYHNTQMKEVLKPGTLKNYYTTEKYVQEFIRIKHRISDIFLDHLNYQFICEFEIFLRKRVPLDHQKKLRNNGLMKHLERLRKMVRLAVKMEWIPKNPFENYQLKFDKVDRGYLTEYELERIENKIFKIERLDWVRDLFIFSCYTGVAYCDTMELKPSHLIQGIDNENWLITSRMKNGEPVKVPLLPKAAELIEKYSNDPKAKSIGRLFPVISNQKLNSYLKEIADLCEIEKDLTFHLARHYGKCKIM